MYRGSSTNLYTVAYGRSSVNLNTFIEVAPKTSILYGGIYRGSIKHEGHDGPISLTCAMSQKIKQILIFKVVTTYTSK